jgi:hypothetical protein
LKLLDYAPCDFSDVRDTPAAAANGDDLARLDPGAHFRPAELARYGLWDVV